MTALVTNIKNLPEGRVYFTEYGYSQSYPWVEVKRTAKTVTLAKVDVKKDPEWKPEFYAGGFCAHCPNQSDQTWLFDSIDEGHTCIVWKSKDGEWRRAGVKFRENVAREFYDYNF